jgi:hypothetical protein
MALVRFDDWFGRGVGSMDVSGFLYDRVEGQGVLLDGAYST